MYARICVYLCVRARARLLVCGCGCVRTLEREGGRGREEGGSVRVSGGVLRFVKIMFLCTCSPIILRNTFYNVKFYIYVFTDYICEITLKIHCLIFRNMYVLPASRLPIFRKESIKWHCVLLQNDWWTALAERTQCYADMGNMRSFYDALKAICGPSHQIKALLHSSDRIALLTDKAAILQRLSEHFENLSSDQSTVQESSLAMIPPSECETRAS